jgi:hypothetical protein
VLFAAYHAILFFVYKTIFNRAKMEVTAMTRGIMNYKLEKGLWPPADFVNADTNGNHALRSQGLVIHELLSQDRNGDRFLSVPIARNGTHNGLIESPAEEIAGIRLVDLWGKEYYFVIDADGDGTVANPEGGRVSGLFGQHMTPVTLAAPVIVYSAGPDHDPNTWDDNLCSWRGYNFVSAFRQYWKQNGFF